MDNTTQKIAAACSVCGKQYRLSAVAVGKTAKCVCGNRFVVKLTQVDAAQAPTPRCAAHPDQTAVGQCIQCAARICRTCAMRTKSGKLACRACVAKHREQQRADTTGPAMSRPRHAERDEQIPLAEIIDDDHTVVAGIPAGHGPPGPGPLGSGPLGSGPLGPSPSSSPFDGLPSSATASAFPASGPQWFAAPAHVANGSLAGADGVARDGVATGGTPPGNAAMGSAARGGRCAQHPASAVVHHCSVCHQAVCRTCAFAFAPNMVCCPECASETSTPLSLHRQAMVYGSLACAILASLMAALLFSGLLVFMDNIPFGGLLLETLIVLPLCLGIGMALGSYNRAAGNPAMLWVGGIWNTLGLISWMLFLGIMTLSGFLID